MYDYIEDGYTEKGFIAADEEGLHGPLEFEYRPMVPAVQGKLLDKKGAENFIDAVAKVLITDGHLVAWSLVNRKDQPVPLSEAAVKKLRPRLFDKLWTVVAGLRPTDRDSRPIDLEADAKNSQ